MSLRFSRKGLELFWLGGEAPKDIPQWAYMYLVTKLKVSPDSLADLLSVQKVGFWGGKLVTFIRIYDPSTIEKALEVKDFTSLDQHPEFILYEGYHEKDSERVFLECRTVPKPLSQ